jgi:two-component system CheB/CheR fusion protein
LTNAEQNPEFEALLQYLKQTRGFDFTGYKRPSLRRLVLKRMQQVGVESFSDYHDYLEAEALEVNQLFDTLLLNVTKFFRNKPAWDYLAEAILPRMLTAKSEHEEIRVWSAGCASGEEAYTIAILLAEALGQEEYCQRVKIYATDADEDALVHARLATYTARDVEDVPEALREKYFEISGSNYIIGNELRRRVIFGRNNVIQDAPIGRLDLLVCRNVLMYLNAGTQARVLARFHFALNQQGFLFVGKAEMLITHANLFTPVNLKHRIFTKVANISLRERMLAIAEAGNPGVGNHLMQDMRCQDEAFEFLPVAQIVVDRNGDLALANREARVTFNLSLQDVGRPLQDLRLSYQPVELRSPIQQARAERRSLQINDVEWTLPEGSSTLYLDIEIIPLQDPDAELVGVSIVFHDVTRYKQLQGELQRTTEELETTNEELQSTNEELETTNEELQSTNEELETTNEELQSTNEELETMNEELQSANEELQATNDELQERTNELNRVNAFRKAILTCVNAGLAVLDNRLSIQLWNGQAEDLWGLRPEEAQGSFFFDLDIGLPVEQLRDDVRACQNGGSDYQEVLLEAINRRGKTITVRVACTPLIVEGAQQGVTLLMEEQ